jgi:hypothetical protein
MTFPQIVAILMGAGFESYLADLRRAVITYYLPDGESVELPATKVSEPIAASFDAAAVKDAIREAQTLVRATPTKASATRSLAGDALVIWCRSRDAVLSILGVQPNFTLSTSRRRNR